MKLKKAVTSAILTVMIMTCFGTVSCGAGANMVTPAPHDNEAVEESDETSPVPDKAPEIPTDTGEEADDEADAYRDEMTAIITELDSVFYALDELLATPDFNSDDWFSEVSLAASDMMTLCEAAGDLVPPESLTDDHAACLEAIICFDDAMMMLLRGLDEASPDLINQASVEMWLAAELLAETTGYSGKTA